MSGIASVLAAACHRAPVFEPTMNLRWKAAVVLEDILQSPRTLQQAWVDKITGEVEWRDVPEEEESKNFS